MQVLAGGGGPSVKITGASLWSPGGATTSRRDLLPWVFCPIGDGLKAPHPPRLRTRGRRVTTPTDAGVITTEPVGEFRGLDADEAIYRHSRAYHAAGFPDLARVCRTTSARQAADPRAVERAPRRRPAGGLPAGRSVRPVDGPSADRHRAKRTWARDLWHLTGRITREVPGHAAMVCLARHHGHHALPFDNLELAA